MWGSRGAPSDVEATKVNQNLGFLIKNPMFIDIQVLQKADDSTLKLVNIDDNKKKGVAPAICLKIVQSPVFTTVVMVVVLANTVFTATIKHTHNEEVDQKNLELYHKIEVRQTSLLFKKEAKNFLLDIIYCIF